MKLGGEKRNRNQICRKQAVERGEKKKKEKRK